MLNVSGSNYDFAHVTYAVLTETEHRRRALEDDHFAKGILQVAREALARIRESYDEIHGNAAYWKELEKEILNNVIPQYAPAAARMNHLERTSFDVWREGDLAARGTFALGGLLLGSVIIALPTVALLENIAALGLTVAGAIYPDLKRFMYERRHARLLNELVTNAARHQQAIGTSYLSMKQIDAAFEAEDA